MTTNAVLEMFIAEYMEVEFECFAADGSTPLNLTGGSAEFDLLREGLTPFSVSLSTTVVGEATWTNQAQGKGKFIINNTANILKVGYCRYELRAIESTGVITVQASGWMKLKRTAMVAS